MKKKRTVSSVLNEWAELHKESIKELHKEMNEEYVISGLTLQFTQEYDNFATFVQKTTDPIYRAIIDTFNDLRKIEKSTLTVQAIVDGTQFDTIFEYTKDDANILKDLINPFFEEMEDYETCKRIMDLYSELTQN
jgi:hypothetical protein